MVFAARSKAREFLDHIRQIQVSFADTEDAGERLLVEGIVRLYNQVEQACWASDGNSVNYESLCDRVGRLRGILQTRFEYRGHFTDIGEGAKIIQGELEGFVREPELQGAAEVSTIPVVGYLTAVETYKIGADYIIALQEAIPPSQNIGDDYPGFRKKIYDVHYSGLYGTAFKNRLLHESDLLAGSRPEIRDERVLPEESFADNSTLNRPSRAPRSVPSVSRSMRHKSSRNSRCKPGRMILLRTPADVVTCALSTFP